MSVIDRGRSVDNLRKYSVGALVTAIAACVLGVVAASMRLWTLSVIVVMSFLFINVVLFVIHMHMLSRSLQNNNLKSHEDTKYLLELVSALETQLRAATLSNSDNQTENRQLAKAFQGDFTSVRSRLDYLEQLIKDNKKNQGTSKREIQNSIRDSERRLTQVAPKSIEVRRAHERIEAAERRVLGTFETHSYSQDLHQSELTNQISDLGQRLERFFDPVRSSSVSHTVMPSSEQLSEEDTSQLQSLVSKINRHVTSTVRDSTRQMEALVHLSAHFSDKKLPMPSTGGFAIDAQALGHLITLIQERRPRRILELGSGASSIWIGYLCRTFGGKIVTIDHLEEYLSLTQTSVDRHHLNGQVECRLAALEKLELDGEDYLWYSLEALEGLEEIDMLIIDGPPASTGAMARYPALPYVRELLAPTATVILDDTQRAEESAILESWLEMFPSFRLIEEGTSRLGVLQRDA